MSGGVSVGWGGGMAGGQRTNLVERAAIAVEPAVDLGLGVVDLVEGSWEGLLEFCEVCSGGGGVWGGRGGRGG